ncbi:hypothetical protein C8A01DRAFT_41767 [Parachaetomium inaequale]|uniref:Uncharacterized protein n=1 Tax=Parachaetomium inaequale TaxID=2588326 RepID=A0AAN6SKJ6_9PEZI|nr:hypothetical protein C8A01DRAFT_41767 [Parachaetomium inaequale]
MPTKGHHRSRSSIDRVIDLLADLEETQITVLLDDLNHTTSSNVPVTDAIALFEHHASKPKRRSCRSPSPMRTLQAELERRHSKRLSKRISSAPEPRPFSRIAASQPPAPREPAAAPPAPVTQHFDRPHSPDCPALSLSPPASVERPRSSAGSPPVFQPRSYKRISRPMFLSPTATAELHLLLLAFFNETPVSPATTATPSPTTPLFGFSHSPFTDFEVEPSTPGLDLLEPSPTRAPSFSAGRSLKAMPSIGSIFEVFRSQ